MKSKLVNDSGIFVDSLGTSHTALHATVFPLWLVPDSLVDNAEQSVIPFLRSKGMACSV